MIIILILTAALVIGLAMTKGGIMKPIVNKKLD